MFKLTNYKFLFGMECICKKNGLGNNNTKVKTYLHKIIGWWWDNGMTRKIMDSAMLQNFYCCKLVSGSQNAKLYHFAPSNMLNDIISHFIRLYDIVIHWMK